MFEHLTWKRDRLLCNGLVFRLQHYKSDDWELGQECFVFYKIKKLVDQYEAFFSSRSFKCKRFLELGLWEGGSLPFWYETLLPEKIIGIDLMERGDSDYFRRYVRDRQLQARMKTFWGVDQADGARLREIVGTEFDGPLDLVLDDASHIYGPTRSSFHTLFPLLRPGGFYIIEDWAWEHWPECHKPDYPLARHAGLTALISQAVQAAGTSESFIKSVTVYEGFAAVERGTLNIPDDFCLEDYIVNRPARKWQLPRIGELRDMVRRMLDHQK